MFLKSVILLFILFLNSVFADARDDEIKRELVTNRAAIDVVQAKMQTLQGQGKFPLSLAMAKWASQKSRDAGVSSADQKKYAAIARDILNEAKGFGWQNRAPTSTEGACMASASIDIALATNDTVESLWNGSRSGVRYTQRSVKAGSIVLEGHYHDFLKRAATVGRNVGSKAFRLTPTGIVTWTRMPGIRNFLAEPIELVEPGHVAGFFTPKTDLVSVVDGGTVADWTAIYDPYAWTITEDANDILLLADDIIRAQNSAWPIRNALPSTLANIRDVYNELKRLGGTVSGDLQAPCDVASAAVALGYSPAKITKLLPLFLLLDPNNYSPALPQDGFDAAGFVIGNIRIESPMAQWRAKANLPDFGTDFVATSALLDQMEPIIKAGGFGGQGVHRLDAFQIDNTKKMLEIGRKYFAGDYTVRTTKSELIAAIDARLTTLGANLTAHYDGRILTKEEIMTHLGYVLNGYPTGFTTALASQSGNDKITEAEWVEILSMIFDFSQKLDSFCLNTGIDMTPFNLESNFYSQLWENQHTRGGCVPGRKDRILYRLANLLRQWMTFGYRLA